MSRHMLALLLLAALDLLFFGPLVLHPGQVLYSDHSDLLAEHLPAKRFLVRSWQATGEVPLWNPYSFGGSPFVHDVQVAAFYPLHLPLYLLPEDAIGPALSWLIVLHIFVAGAAMYALATYQGLGLAGSLVAALGTMFAGKWMLHLLAGGHYITSGLAWLPLVLLWLEQAVRQRSLVRATWAGGAFGLLVLGTHPQWTFYAGLLVALWTLGPALEEAGYLGGPGTRSAGRTARALGQWLLLGAWTALVAAALAAVQLLPALEAAAQSTRAAGVGPGGSAMTVLLAAAWMVGPALSSQPPNFMWDERGGFGLLWLALALLAPSLGSRRTRYQALVCFLLLAFALGGANLLQGLPGFGAFRQPTRMFLVAAFPVAFLAGAAVDALVALPGPSAAGRRRGRVILVALALLVAALAGFDLLRIREAKHALRLQPYWPVLAVSLPLALWLLGRRATAGSRLPLAWGAVLLADVLALAWPLVEVRPEAAFFTPSACVQYLAEHAGSRGRVFDRDAPGFSEPVTPLGAGAPLALILGIESLRGYNPMDVLRYKEYLLFLGDDDRPLRPFTVSVTFPVISDFPVTNKSLLDLLGVRYLLQPAELRRLPRHRGATSQEPSWQKVFEDPAPEAFNFIVGGVLRFPPYVVYENREVFPRAFVVQRAAPLPGSRSEALQALKAANLRQLVLLEDFEGTPDPAAPDADLRPATITEYLPNRVTVQVHDSAPGYLVLADIWFPGWSVTVDGAPAHLHRADYLFRAVRVPAGTHEIAFTFRPESYAYGKAISGLALAGVLAISAFGLLRRRRLGQGG